MSLIIDCDSHFMPDDAFDDEEARRYFRNRWPRKIRHSNGRDWTTFPERERALTAWQRTLPGEMFPARHAPGYADAGVRLEWMDRMGIDVQVLVYASSLFAYAIEPELGAALCRSYNNALARVLQRHPGRFIGLAALPMQDPVAAVEELDRAVGELGIHAPVVISNVNGRNLSECEFWPVFEHLEQLDVPLIIHGDLFQTPGHVGLDRLDHMRLDNALGMFFEGSLVIANLIMYGVLDMYPRLRVGLLETGAGYISYLMDRLNELYRIEVFGGISPFAHVPIKELISKAPVEYINQLWLCTDLPAEERSIRPVVERFGADRFIVGSDFPHGLGGSGETMVDGVRHLEALNAGQKEQLLGLSAAALWGIDPTTRKQNRPAASHQPVTSPEAGGPA